MGKILFLIDGDVVVTTRAVVASSMVSGFNSPRAFYPHQSQLDLKGCMQHTPGFYVCLSPVITNGGVNLSVMIYPLVELRHEKGHRSGLNLLVAFQLYRIALKLLLKRL